MMKLQVERKLDHELWDYRFPLPITTLSIEAYFSSTVSGTTYTFVGIAGFLLHDKS